MGAARACGGPRVKCTRGSRRGGEKGDCLCGGQLDGGSDWRAHFEGAAVGGVDHDAEDAETARGAQGTGDSEGGGDGEHVGGDWHHRFGGAQVFFGEEDNLADGAFSYDGVDEQDVGVRFEIGHQRGRVGGADRGDSLGKKAICDGEAHLIVGAQRAS